MEAPGYDLIIAGAGPAGCACAITAARSGARVLLLDKDRFPRHKVCGEFVSPEALGLLEWLLETRTFGSRPELPCSRIFFADRIATLPISPPALSIMRFDLDAELLKAARKAGAHAEEGATITRVDEGRVFTVVTADKTFTARAVVNASGRWSQLKQQPAGTEKWLGLKAHFREADPARSMDLYFFDGGYCGVSPVRENVINACCLVRADVARSLDEVLARHPALWRRSRDWQAVIAPLSTSGMHFQVPQTEAGGMLLAGDAAAFIDPFAGDGISLALHSGTLAGQALAPFLQGKTSLAQAREDYRRNYRRHLAPALRHAGWVRRLLSAPTWMRTAAVRLAGTKVVGRWLVRSTRVKSRFTTKARRHAAATKT